MSGGTMRRVMALHRRHAHAAALLLLPLTLALFSSHARGQLRPGIERGDYWGEIRARYRSEVLEGVGQTMESWLEAWNGDDVTGLMETYAQDGVLILGADAYAEPESMRAAATRLLLQAGPIEFGLEDFGVSGDMAFATTRFRYAENPGRPGSAEVSGRLLWIMMKEEGNWRIRSQIFQAPRD